MDLRAFLAREKPVFLLALQFLTRLPVSVGTEFSADLMRETPRWYPGVGVLVGVITGALFWGASALFPPLVAALVSTAGGILLTGGMHEDGFADVCDGLGGGRSRERALEIMRDSRLGTYGTLGLGLMLAAKVATLASLPVMAVPFVLIAAHAASRAATVWVIVTSQYARTEGAGRPVADGIDPPSQAMALATAVLACLPLLFVLPLHSIAFALAGLAAGHFAMRSRFETRLGGYTGDCLGAVQQCSELGFYLGALAFAVA